LNFFSGFKFLRVHVRWVLRSNRCDCLHLSDNKSVWRLPHLLPFQHSSFHFFRVIFKQLFTMSGLTLAFVGGTFTIALGVAFLVRNDGTCDSRLSPPPCTTGFDVPCIGCDPTCFDVDLPFPGCIIPVCNTSCTDPYLGCIIAKCTDVDVPYDCCLDPPTGEIGRNVNTLIKFD